MRTIAHISDLHFGRHDQGLVDGLLASLAAQRPDVVVVSGDLTQRARTHEFVEARRFLDSIKRPLVVVPGNHDIPLFNVLRRLGAPRRSYQKHIGSAGTPDCFYGDAEMAILGLDTVRRLKWKEGRVSLEQMARIQRVLAPLPAQIWKIVVSHHPIASANSGPQAEVVARASRALRAIASAQVHLLLSGHHHHAVSGEGALDLAMNRSVLVIHAGTTVSTRTRANHTNSYNVIRLQSPRVTVQVMECRNGSAFEEASQAAYALDKERWQVA